MSYAYRVREGCKLYMGERLNTEVGIVCPHHRKSFSLARAAGQGVGDEDYDALWAWYQGILASESEKLQQLIRFGEEMWCAKFSLQQVTEDQIMMTYAWKERTRKRDRTAFVLDVAKDRWVSLPPSFEVPVRMRDPSGNAFRAVLTFESLDACLDFSSRWNRERGMMFFRA